MNSIKNSLTRKIGPLPAWGWFLILIAVVYYWRKRQGGGVSGTGTGSVAPAPSTPQPDQVLQPGESVYDPNTGGLLTAPGGGNNPSQGIGGGGGGDTNPPTVTPTTPPPGTTNSTPPGSSVAPAAPPPKLGKGARRAPWGGRKPKAPKGFRTVGQGRGFWEFVPNKRTPKPKVNHPAPKGGGRKRSSASIHPSGVRGKPASAVHGSNPNMNRAPTAESSSRLRKRTLTPPVKAVIRQRPEAATRPSHRPEAAPNHRPSAPPPRKVRVPRRHK